jgi:amidase
MSILSRVLLLAALCSSASAAQLTPVPRDGGPALELVEATLGELQFALHTGQVTSVELVEAYLARIAAHDEGAPGLNGIMAVNPVARDEARARDLERAAGRARGPLFGIPVLVNDNIDVAGLPTTAGSLALAASFPPDDAFLVRRLRAAGAIVLGKTTLTEFANFLTNGMPSGYGSLAGYGYNPYDPRPAPNGEGRPILTPGGSSSGTGISIAASFAAVGVGTETSGSILSPASSNALVGIKPTVGLISRDGILPITADQDTPGPMARSVRDAALLLGVLAGYDPADPATRPCAERGRCPGDYTPFLDKEALVGARIGVPRTPYWNSISGAQRTRMRKAIAVLRAEGATVIDPFEIPDQTRMSQLEICVNFPAANNCSIVLLYGFKHDLNAYLAGLGPAAPMRSLADIIEFNRQHPLEALVFGQSIALAAERIDTSPLSADTERYRRDRTRDLNLFRNGLDEAFRGPGGLADTGDEFDALLFPANFGADAPARAGYPSLTVPGRFLDPAGNIENPFPFGITFTGQAFSEPRLIGLAYDFEQATRHRSPPLSTPPLSSTALGR